MKSKNNHESMVVIAKIGAPYGLDGDMRLYIFCQPPEKAVAYKTWHIRMESSQSWLQLKGEAVYQLGEKFLIHLEAVSTPEEAKKYVNAEIGVKRLDLPEVAEDEYYWADLIGLEVLNDLNQYLGVVVDLIESPGANDVLVVNDKGCERLIPFVNVYIKEVNFDAKQILVDWHLDY
ncbi:ribosome maturation factor RimM [Thiotrichales bacterium 19S9-12]|nr:ribosome maturation factor RimM [Thiotrichales bacterium 19S9-11]MCF6812103.1 ribosome maturation factor RimM [Thiotrichales bacterium 19S9-12]